MSKGQYLSVEQMILFGVGVTIMVTTFLIFSSIKSSVREASLKDQLYEVGSFVAEKIESAYLAGSGSKLRATIPKKLSGLEYRLRLSSKGLKVSFPGKAKVAIQLAINESVQLRGFLFSSKGKIMIGNQDGEIRIK